MHDRRLRRRSGVPCTGCRLPKTYKLPVLRVEPDLGERIKVDQEKAGDRTMAATVRRLIERGLGNPFLQPREAEQFNAVLYELRKIGVNLNQLSRAQNQHGSLRDFQVEDLGDLARANRKLCQQIETLLVKSK